MKRKLDMHRQSKLSNLDDFIRLIRHISKKCRCELVSIGETNADNRNMMAELSGSKYLLRLNYKYYDSIFEFEGLGNDEEILKETWNYIKKCIIDINFKKGEKVYYDDKEYIVLEETNFSDDIKRANQRFKVSDEAGNIIEISDTFTYKYE